MQALESSPNEGNKVIPAAEVAEVSRHQMCYSQLTWFQLSDADLSVLEDGSPVKPKKPKGEGKKKVRRR
jgi:hypothetical protein